jgi:Flp pilus assembly pilin Flp
MRPVPEGGRRPERGRAPAPRRASKLPGEASRFLRDERGQAMAEYVMILFAVVMLNEVVGVISGRRLFVFGPNWQDSYVGDAILTFYEGIIRFVSSPVP